MLRYSEARSEVAWTGVTGAAGHTSWQAIDRALRAVAKRRCALDAEEAQLLAQAIRNEIWRRLGKASLHEYLEDVLGYSPRLATERIRVATTLEDLPAISDALARGELHYSAVRELTRVAVRATEAQWLAHVRRKSLRQIEQAVAGRKRGDRPDAPADPELIATPLRFDVRPATRALLRQAQRVLEEERGHRMDDDELISALCGAVLDHAVRGDAAGGGTVLGDTVRGGSANGGDETGRAKHQILVTTCEACGAAWQTAGGAKAPLDAADRARVECDAQRIGADGRAAQDIPPRIARLVHRRDGGKCSVPWCRASRYLEIHHVIPREHGGSHEPANLTLLCDGHHRAHHQGKLAITGAAPALVFCALDDTHVGESDTHVGESNTHVGELDTHVDESDTHVGESDTHVGAEREPATHVGTERERATHVGTERERATHVGTEPAPATHVGTEPAPATHVDTPQVTRDAELSLTALGFRAREATSAVRAALTTLAPAAPLEALVRAALRRIT